jgi:exonuclease III
MHSIRIASININDISTTTRVGMLIDFIRRHDLDLVFLQEETHPAILTVTGYTTYLNILANMSGTAILHKTEFPLTNVTSLPTGCAIAADYNGIRLVNVYAPAVTAKRSDREHFFNSELPALFYAAKHSVSLGGDFNCVLHPTDTSSPFTTSRALTEVIRGLVLSDAWNQDPQRPAYTHLSPTVATRIDRFYITHGLLLRKIGTAIVPAAFTDHNAVVLRLSQPTVRTFWRRGRWKMDPVLVTDEAVKEKIRSAWAKWQRSKHYSSDESLWWEPCVKPQLQRLFRQEEAERRANYRNMENHLYKCLYDVLRSNAPAKD